MTINERVKYFRKNVLHLNQTDFAVSVGMKQTSISTLEKPGATVSEQFIKTICSVYSINEDWLRNGNEPIKIESTVFSLDDFAKSHGATSQELEILKAYFELPSDIRQYLINHFTDRLMHKLFNNLPETPEELEGLYPPVRKNGVQAG